MIKEEGHIGLLEATVLVYAILSAKLFMQAPGFLIEAGGPAAWQAALVMTAAGLLLLLPVGALARRFPGQGLPQIAEAVGGPVLGSLFSLYVLAWLFATTANSLRNFTEVYIGTILPNTPPSVLTFVALFCMAYGSYRGLESVGRATQVLLPVILAGIVLVLVFSMPRLQLSRLYPFWGHGLVYTVSGGAYNAGLLAEAIVVLILAYSLRDAKNVRKAGMLGVALFGLLSALTCAVLVMIFGAPDAAQQPFPLFNLSQLVYLGRFMQRTEALIVMFWFFNVAVRLIVLFHALVVTLTGMLRLPYHRPVIFPMAVLLFSTSLLPEDTLVVLRIMRDWLTPSGLGILFVPFLLLALALIRGKGVQSHAA
ncbi:MAG TPA: endospore germination permease [Symbiobacteriaceae bacterium]|jgi:spore germination protein KB|nr:endospore germination permease [Symbiobacteriaceae bacterium]